MPSKPSARRRILADRRLVCAADVARWRRRLERPWADVLGRLAAAAAASGRAVPDICLLAVSKHHPAAAVCAAYELGQRDFGENYVAGLLEKKAAVEATGRRPRWHFTGRMQSNKIASIVAHCDVVHSLCRKREVTVLSRLRRSSARPLTVYLQVSADGDEARGGVALAELESVCVHARRLSLPIVGLMGLPPREAEVKHFFLELSARARDLCARGLLMRAGLSMGMSGDLEIAIESGATIIRIGTALFGAREPPPL